MKRYQVLRDCFGFKGRSWKKGEVVELGASEKPPHHFHDLAYPLPKSSRVKRPAVSDATAKRAPETPVPTPFEETGAGLLPEEKKEPETPVEPEAPPASEPEAPAEPQPEPAGPAAPEPYPTDAAPAAGPKGKKSKKKK